MDKSNFLKAQQHRFLLKIFVSSKTTKINEGRGQNTKKYEVNFSHWSVVFFVNSPPSPFFASLLARLSKKLSDCYRCMDKFFFTFSLIVHPATRMRIISFWRERRGRITSSTYPNHFAIIEHLQSNLFKKKEEEWKMCRKKMFTKATFSGGWILFWEIFSHRPFFFSFSRWTVCAVKKKNKSNWSLINIWSIPENIYSNWDPFCEIARRVNSSREEKKLNWKWRENNTNREETSHRRMNEWMSEWKEKRERENWEIIL